MSGGTMTSLDRVLTTLGMREPDRVPLFLLATMHGALEVGVSIERYFRDPRLVAEGQVRLHAKLGDDCLYGFFYAPIEVEAFGGEVVFVDDGPPNAGAPIFRTPAAIDALDAPPTVADSPCLRRVCEATELMRERVGSEVPIIGVVMSPFSLPVMQMGFEGYLQLMYEDVPRFERLMAINEAFCVGWANAQLAAGATAICYFDPVASTTCVTREQYLELGFPVAKRTISRINGPTATHLASGRGFAIVGDLAETGTAVVGVSALEDIGRLKREAAGRVSLLGNLNGVEMVRWTHEEAAAAVRTTIGAAARGGGFVLSDNHGEIPLQVPMDTLLAIAEATRTYGRYPIVSEEPG